VERRILAAVAADGHHRGADGRLAIGAADADRLDRRVGEDAHEGEVALQIP
jgi:hypothetical protein